VGGSEKFRQKGRSLGVSGFCFLEGRGILFKSMAWTADAGWELRLMEKRGGDTGTLLKNRHHACTGRKKKNGHLLQYGVEQGSDGGTGFLADRSNIWDKFREGGKTRGVLARIRGTPHLGLGQYKSGESSEVLK